MMADDKDERTTDYVDVDFRDAVTKGTMREALDALIALAAHELSGNRCSKCQMSQMKTGDIASLMLRTQKLLEERNAIPEPGEEKSQIEKMKEARNAGASVTALPGTLGTKKGPRQQGGRTRGFGGKSG
jgi:hypothetical protein